MNKNLILLHSQVLSFKLKTHSPIRNLHPLKYFLLLDKSRTVSKSRHWILLIYGLDFITTVPPTVKLTLVKFGRAIRLVIFWLDICITPSCCRSNDSGRRRKPRFYLKLCTTKYIFRITFYIAAESFYFVKNSDLK